MVDLRADLPSTRANLSGRPQHLGFTFLMASAPIHSLSATHRRLRLSLGLALACISIVDGFLYSPMQTLLNRVGCHKVASCARNQRNGVLVRLVSILYVSRSTASEFCRDVSKCDDERSKLQQIPLILSCVFSNPGRLEHGWSRGQACLCC